eukprot:6287869-Amphidinium_carterae.3
MTIWRLMKMTGWELKAGLRNLKLMTNTRMMGKKCSVFGVAFSAGGGCLNRQSSEWFRRAGAQYNESKYVSLHHRSTSLKRQAMAAFCDIIVTNAAQTHILAGVDHKVVERIYTSLRSVVAASLVQGVWSFRRQSTSMPAVNGSTVKLMRLHSIIVQEEHGSRAGCLDSALGAYKAWLSRDIDPHQDQGPSDHLNLSAPFR